MNKDHRNMPATTQKTPTNSPEIQTELLQQFLLNQSKELEIRSRELELQHKTEDHNFEYAKSALAAQVEDRKASRDHVYTTKKSMYFFIFGLSLLILAILGYALYLGKDNIALEIIKPIIFLLSGGAGGYAIGKSMTSKQKEDGAKP